MAPLAHLAGAALAGEGGQLLPRGHVNFSSIEPSLVASLPCEGSSREQVLDPGLWKLASPHIPACSSFFLAKFDQMPWPALHEGNLSESNVLDCSRHLK